MDFGPHTLQIFVSLGVILAVAAVALICDLLKTNNEHLKELTVELKVRKDEVERQLRAVEKRLDAESGKQPAFKPLLAASAQPKPDLVASSSGQLAAPPTRLQTGKADGERRSLSPAVAAVAASVAARASARNAEPAPVPAPAPAAPPAERKPAAKKDWSRILSARNAPVIPFATLRVPAALPPGFHEYGILQGAVDAGKTIHGLVVSISANRVDLAKIGLITEFVRTLLGGVDFGCQNGADEYVLICPGDDPVLTQRRLTTIAEKLWDFQLQSMGTLDVQFSWGAKEASGEKIGEVLAAAIEQMQETRQSRQSIAQAG
jgi:hypothetical protein